MAEAFIKKKIAPAAINALKEALTNIYWYKLDLRSFLVNCIDDPSILSRLNWSDFKRNIVTQLVDFLASNEEVYQHELMRLMVEVVKIKDFSHLAKLDGGEQKVSRARGAVRALEAQIPGLQEIIEEKQEIDRRRKEAHKKIVTINAVRQALDKLTSEYQSLIICEDPQARGYKLENILRELFEIFDLDPKASFKITGEQIDGAFTFEGTDYLLECRWQKKPIRATDLDSLSGKLSRKLDNTLGLYLAINGYSTEGVSAHSSGRRLLLLMDGQDLMAVLEGRIDLVQLLLRKRRAAAQTGNIYLKVQEILTNSD